MSNRRYKSVEFKQVDWERVGSQIESERVVFAVDIAKEDFVATVLDDEQRAPLTFKWSRPRESAEVIEHMRRLGQGRRLEAVMEPSGTYGDALAWQLCQAGIALYRVSPKRVHDVAEVYDGVPSLHDAKAAYLIGRLHLQGVSQRWPQPGEARRELKAILTELGVYKERQQGARSRLEAHLSRHWPEILSLLGLDMGYLPNETDSMPRCGHPMREVRLTPWVPIRKLDQLCINSCRANSPGVNDKSSLLPSPLLFARVETGSTIKGAQRSAMAAGVPTAVPNSLRRRSE
jgi:hypothetical protein